MLEMTDKLNSLETDLIIIKNSISSIADETTKKILKERRLFIENEIKYLQNPWQDVDDVIEIFKEKDYCAYNFFGVKVGRFIDYIKYLKGNQNDSNSNHPSNAQKGPEKGQ